MIEYNEKNIKTWSLVGSRATFGLISLELAKKEKDLMILTSDVSCRMGGTARAVTAWAGQMVY